jgi:hypothetical protein
VVGGGWWWLVVCRVVGVVGNEPWVLRQSILVVTTTMSLGIYRLYFAED